jgi:hypothetical protein
MNARHEELSHVIVQVTYPSNAIDPYTLTIDRSKHTHYNDGFLGFFYTSFEPPSAENMDNLKQDMNSHNS